MNTLFSNIKYLIDDDRYGYYGYEIYAERVEYFDANEMIGFGDPKYWSHQEFYNEFNNQKHNIMANEVIEFLVTNKLVKTTDTTQK